METILQWDTELFYAINGCRNNVADVVFALLSAPVSIAMVLLAVFIWIAIHPDKRKYIWIPLLMTGACFLFSDRISVLCFKDIFCRLRPCHALEGVFLVKLKGASLIYDHCGGQYGFISSHAANVFSVAIAIGLYFRKHRFLLPLLLLWAGLVGYSRIYCGVHYFGDVLCGALVGGLIGWGLSFVAMYLRQHLQRNQKP